VRCVRLLRARSLGAELRWAREETEAITLGGPESLLELDLDAHGARVNALLRRTSELVRAEAGPRRRDRRGADLIGADLRGARLDAADLSSSLFVTQVQLDSARGDALTRLPRLLDRPAHW